VKKMLLLAIIVLIALSILSQVALAGGGIDGGIAYRAYKYTLDHDVDKISVINTDGTNKTSLIQAEYTNGLSWDPSGTKIQFAYEDSDNKSFSIVKNINGETEWKKDAWISDSSWINADAIIYGGFSGLWKINLSTGEEKQILTPGGYVKDHNPIYSPDQRNLAFVHHEWGSDFTISVINNITDSETPYQGENRYGSYFNPRLTTIMSGDSNFNENMMLQYTPEGNLFFGTDESNGKLWFVNNPTENFTIQQYTDTNGINEFRLSHDGTMIAYATNEGLVLLKLDGSTKKLWSGHIESNLSWAPDDKAICFSTSDDKIIIVDLAGKAYKVTTEIDATISQVEWSPKQTSYLLTPEIKPMPQLDPPPIKAPDPDKKTPENPTFIDMSNSHWAYAYIIGLYKKGVVSGYPDGSFRPEHYVTRAEIAKMIVLALEDQESNSFSSFSDVMPFHWANGYVVRGQELGFINGYPDNTFKPDYAVTRAEVVKMCVSAKKIELSGNGITFPDVPDTYWAYTYIVTSKNMGVVSGYPDGRFLPNNFVTRAEVAKILYEMNNG